MRYTKSSIVDPAAKKARESLFIPFAGCIRFVCIRRSTSVSYRLSHIYEVVSHPLRIG